MPLLFILLSGNRYYVDFTTVNAQIIKIKFLRFDLHPFTLSNKSILLFVRRLLIIEVFKRSVIKIYYYYYN